MLLTTLSAMQITYIICIVIFGILSVVSLILHFYFKNKKSNKLMVRNSGRDGIWEFTKKNFWMFCFLVFAVFSFTFIMLYIGA